LRKPKRYFLATAVSALPFLKRIAADVEKYRPGISITVGAVKNRFFGESVSVAGLLTAKDVLQAIREAKWSQKITCALLPRAMFNYAGVTLDGYSAARLAREAGMPIRVIEKIGELLDL